MKTHFFPAAGLLAALALAFFAPVPAAPADETAPQDGELELSQAALENQSAPENETSEENADTLFPEMQRGGSGWKFTADDNSGDSAYTVGKDWDGLNGGTGFKAWESVGADPRPGSRIIETNGGWTMQADDSGPSVVVMKREFGETAGDGLVEGEINVTAWGYADEVGDFTGFALYDGDSEVFRWGLGVSDDDFDVFKYSTDGGTTYEILKDGYPADGAAYTLTWTSLGAETTLTLSESHYFPEGRTIMLDHSIRVTAIAALLEEGGVCLEPGDGTAMTFDDLSVRGNPASTPSVPEPATLSLLIPGLALLFRRRPR